MGYINKTSLAVDAILTKKGIDYLRTAVFGENQNGEHVITKFALADDEIDYGLWDETPSGSNYVRPLGTIIDNQPIVEPVITDNEIMSSLLFKEGIVLSTQPEAPIVSIPPVANFSMFSSGIPPVSKFNMKARDSLTPIPLKPTQYNKSGMKGKGKGPFSLKN